jgi:uncharacterized protein (TIGR00251 family)
MAAPPSAKGSLLRVRVTPGAPCDGLAGFVGEELRVRLSAPPVDGKANAALLKFLAKSLGLRASGLELRSGASSRSKVIRIEGLSKEEALSRLEGAMGPQGDQEAQGGEGPQGQGGGQGAGPKAQGRGPRARGK